MKLWNRNFLLVVIGQIISLFGNGILRFALPLYLLDQTGSSTVFGAAMACSFLPMAILSPVGGILSDRLNKRTIMAVLDFMTAFLTLLFLAFMKSVSPVVLVTAVMMILGGIQALYQPTVQASMPALQKSENLMAANAVVNQIQALAGLLGPIIGGVVYGLWGIIPVVSASCACFLVSAIMELFIVIPYTRQKAEKGIMAIVKKDMSDSITFIRREQPVICYVVVIIALFNLFLSAMIIVGIPVIIKIYLGLSSQLYGYAEGVGAFGGLLGGILTGVLASRLNIRKAWKLLLYSALIMLPMCIALSIGLPATIAYIVITLCYGGMMAIATMFTVQMLAYVQAETPSHLVGKVISLAMAASMCAQPIGQAMYGVLFDRFSQIPYLVMGGSIVAAAVIALASRRIFKTIKTVEKPQMVGKKDTCGMEG